MLSRNFFVIFITKSLCCKILFKVLELYYLHFTTWVSFSANKSVMGDFNFLVELGVANSSYYTTFISYFTIFLVKVFVEFPNKDCFVLRRAYNNSVSMELNAANLSLMLL